VLINKDKHAGADEQALSNKKANELGMRRVHITLDGVDSHGWLSPQNAVVWMQAIATELQRVDPTNSKRYQQNTERSINRLEAWITNTHQRIQQHLQDDQSTPFVVFHDAYQYIEQFTGLAAAAAIADSHAERPGARRLLALKRFVASGNVNCLLIDERQPLRLVSSVYGDQLPHRQTVALAIQQTERGLEAYIELLDGLVDAMLACSTAKRDGDL